MHFRTGLGLGFRLGLGLGLGLSGAKVHALVPRGSRLMSKIVWR